MKQLVEIIQADITSLTVDVIVNAANSTLLGGAGVDGAIHKVAGPALLEECRKLGGCETGCSKITKGYNLPSRFVIHTVGPIWQGGGQNEQALLAQCYSSALNLAEQHALRTIAFPCISTGAYGYPFEPACVVALSTIRDYLIHTTFLFEKVLLTCFSNQDYRVFFEIYESQFQKEMTF